MVCHARSASLSARRNRQLSVGSPPPSLLALLDLTKPGEREAYEFLLRAISKRDCMWKLLDLRRQGTALLCVVRWVHLDDSAKPFSLVEVRLIERAVCWRDYTSSIAACAELLRLCDEPTYNTERRDLRAEG